MKLAVPKNSVAVLPFVVLSLNKESEYLGDGLASEIINALSKVKTLKVIARTSSFSFKHEKIDIVKIGRLLGVANIIEGSVNISENAVRVSVQLISSESGFQLWAESYKRSFVDLFNILEELVLEIVARLITNFNTNRVAASITEKRTTPEAYHLYLEGLYHWNMWTYDHILKAIELLEKAIKVDADLAIAYTSLANCWSLLGAIHRTEPKYASQIAKQYVLKALQIDEKLAESYVALGLILLLNDTDLKGAYYAFEKALYINPNCADAHHSYSFYLLSIGKNKEAIGELQIALQIDPLSQQINSTYGYALMVDEKYNRAINQFEKTLDIDPKSESAMSSLCWTYIMTKEYAHAQKYLSENIEYILQSDATQSYLYAMTGENKKAVKSMLVIKNATKKSSLNRELSMCWIGLNNFEEADKYLNKFYSEKIGFAMVLSHPAWKSFRTNQRFLKYKNRLSLLNMPLFNPDNEIAEQSSFVVIKSKTKEELILNVSDIIYIKADSVYSEVVWQEEGILKKKILRATIGEIEKQVITPKLIRCHRSYIINTSIKFELIGTSRHHKLLYKQYNLKIPISISLERKVLEKLHL